MDKLKAIGTFVRIADEGSLSGAARVLDMSLPAVVRALAALEADLGVRLFNRSTRRIALTEEGRRYLDSCRNLLAALDEAESGLRDEGGEPSGALTVTAPVLFGQLFVAPAITRFVQRFSRVHCRVLLFDRRGFGSSPGTPSLSAEPGDTVLAVDRLRQEGVDRVLTMASSMGNSVMFSALPDLPEKPCGVISVSPVLRSGDAGGSVDGSRIAGLPDNLWVTWESGNPSIVANAQRVLDAAGPGAHAHAVDTTDHSIVLVDNHADVRDFLAEAAASCGSGS